MDKIFSAFLFALLVCTLVFAGFTCMSDVQVQAASKKPIIPEFTATFVAGSSEVSPPFQQWIDPYTGKTMDTTMTTPSYTVDFEVIRIEIKNPNHPNKLQYNVRTKGYFLGSESWRDVYDPNSGYPQQEAGSYTIINIDAKNYPDGGKIDAQVEALDGYLEEKGGWEPETAHRWYYKVFVGETSGWSNTKTVTITRENNEAPNQNDATSNYTSSTDQNEPQTEMTLAGLNLVDFSLGVVLGVIVAGLSIALVYKHKTSTSERWLK